MTTGSTLFPDLYHELMTFNFMKAATPAFGKSPTLPKVKPLVSAGALHLPAQFRSAYSDPLVNRIDGLYARLMNAAVPDVGTLETLTGAVYQEKPGTHTPDLHRFLAVISNLYRSFLDKSKRLALNIPLKETLPPLAVFQSDPGGGPFTITVENVTSLIGGSVGVVSLPATFAGHPFLYGSLAHETGGHDVLHADGKLLPQLRSEMSHLFSGSPDTWQGLLWDYWMDEAASDVYGLLNVGPTFGANLAALLAVFIGQNKQPKPASPGLRTASGADEQGYLDEHPTDILRLALVQGVIESLRNLTPAIARQYIDELDTLAEICAPNASTVELAGFARVKSGQSINFNHSVPLDLMRLSARKVGAHIATTPLEALNGRSIQDIETWDDADESAASNIAALLLSGKSISGAGDDAQIIAGLTLALLQQPSKYAAMNKLANSALDESFQSDPYWSLPSSDRFILKSSRPIPPSLPAVDPYAERIIDFNPLESQVSGQLGGLLPHEIINNHAIATIPWPKNTNPVAKPLAAAPAPDAALPKCDYVLMTWTAAEANAMANVLTPGYIAMPPSSHVGGNVWYKYAHNFAKYVPQLNGRSPAMQAHDLGKYFFTEFSGKRVLCFKSSLHLARDGSAPPVKDLFKQVAQETGASLIITTGTAGAIGPRLILGDAVIATSAKFDCKGRFKNAPFNNRVFKSDFTLPNNAFLKTANEKLIAANVGRLPAGGRAPRIFSGPIILGEENSIVTTDIFAYDDATNFYHLQGLGSMVEMDDAVLALACEEMGGKAPSWLAIRNASDPQIASTADKEKAAKIYEDYGYWTSLTSVLACWAMIA